ncbi:hypothetical protein LPW11_00855 [Geomonas sp. RF6]|uniref:hypothetical protein n=1 Tax=Geomonas sp. RF6 TaxID=2897342 RepID=UPI001E4A2055|nr:hypothetical protein [Geomonas sp. RF6]UFS70753.1 hypothetical protein LPW11_00855 [Geomonas sp. RF6]
MFPRNVCTVPLALFLFLSITGCTVLTRSQFTEVGKFAAAAKGYGDLPGAVISRHAEIRRDRQVLRVVTFRNGTTALAGIEGALKTEAKLKEKGRQADQALEVLSDYAELLSLLTAERYSTELQTSAEALGQKIDSGIRQYNKTWNRSVGAAGSTVAALVRGGGGFYLRARQARSLRKVVVAADPMVASLTGTVQEIMAFYLDETQLAQLRGCPAAGGKLVPGGVLAQEKRDVALFYRGVAGQYQGRQPPELPLKVAEVMDASDTAGELAARALQAACTFRQAHAELVGSVTAKKDLAGALEEVNSLAAEVTSAQALKKKLDRK